jgi:hypothetical protein
MSKGASYAFHGTKGDIVHMIQNLPPRPDKEFLQDWSEFINEKAIGKTTSREFFHNETKLRVRFDHAEDGKPGFKGKNHWHVYNPNMTNKKDRYLDKDGNPTAKDSPPSHIIPKYS